MTIYFRNPDRYRQVLGRTDIAHFSWDMGRITRGRMDILKWGKLFLRHIPEWTMLVVAREGVAEYNQDSKTTEKPIAVYPTWHIEEGFDVLIAYCKNPVGENEDICKDRGIHGRFRPVLGQRNKIIIYSAPDLRKYEGGAMLRRIMEIGREYPDVEFIIHDTASFRLMFSTEFSGAIFDPYHTASKGSVIMPSGAVYAEENWFRHQKWIKMLGYQMAELREEKNLDNRLLYNIDSVHWAEQNYNKNVDFTLRATRDIDISSKQGKYELKEEREAWLTGGATRHRMVLGPDDGYACNNCSLSKRCKFFRRGMVCGVPKGKTYELTKSFGTRDASVIIDGLVKLTEVQAKRVEADLEEEEETGERLLATDKRIKDLMDSGVKVAKLINPKLAGGAMVNIGMIGGAVAVGQLTPQELMANAVRALEQQGVPREEITSDMIRGLLEGVNNRALVERTVEAEAQRVEGKQIEGKVIEG